MLPRYILVLGLVSPILSLPSLFEKLILRRNLARVSYKECAVNPSERRDCGHYGITEEGCYARECCWNESEENGVPWCYHSIPTSSKLCIASENDREACGWSGIRKEQCMKQNCCWRPKSKDSNEPCFKKKRFPVFTGECGHPAIKPVTFGRVIGGDEARPHSWPWVVSLQSDGHHHCGGSLINHQWVLSAGHCDMMNDDVDVLLGAHNITIDDVETTKLSVPVARTFVHENYGGINGFDFMLVKMERPVEFNNVISPICLATITPNDGKYCYQSGWGLTKMDLLTHETERPDLLQQVMMPVISQERCNNTEIYNGTIHETEMCTGWDEGGRSGCFGDSGSPLVCRMNNRWEQVGIVSWGAVCAGVLVPNVYADVSGMLEWIENTVINN